MPEKPNYDMEYMRTHHYLGGRTDDNRRAMKLAQVRLIQRITGAGRMLFAGTACGTEILAARELEIPVFAGFDVCEVPFPEVSVGNLADRRTWPRVPPSVGQEYHWDVLVAVDVFEHLTEQECRAAVRGARVENIPWIAAAISRDAAHAGHITLHWLSWWCDLFSEAGYLLVAEPRHLLPSERDVYGIKTFDRCWRDDNPSAAILFWRSRERTLW